MVEYVYKVPMMSFTIVALRHQIISRVVATVHGSVAVRMTVFANFYIFPQLVQIIFKLLTFLKFVKFILIQ